MSSQNPIVPSGRDSRDVMNMSARINPPEIFNTINQLAATVNEPMPGLWERLTQPGAKQRAEVINEIKTSRIEAVNEFIGGLKTQVALYVKAHENDFKIVSAAAYIGRFEQIYPELERMSSNTLISFLDNLSSELSRMDGYPNLPPAYLDKQREAAMVRADEARDHAYKTFKNLIDQFAELVKGMVADSQGNRTK